MAFVYVSSKGETHPRCRYAPATAATITPPPITPAPERAGAVRGGYAASRNRFTFSLTAMAACWSSQSAIFWASGASH